MTLNYNWVRAFEVMKTQHDLNEDSIGVFAVQLKFNLEDPVAIAAEAVTGGGDDKGCDILFVDRELGVAVIAQCYIAATPKQAASAGKAADLNQAVSWLMNTPLENLPDGLKGRADEFRSAITEGAVQKIFVWFVHNCHSSINVQKELTAVEASVRTALNNYQYDTDINVFSQEISTEQLETLYTQAERTIIVTDPFETKVPDAVEYVESDWSSVITTVSGKWLADQYKKYKTDLFSANLRGYLGSRASDTNINNGIKKTANQESNNFFVYNNGITALVLDYDLGKRTRGGRKLSLTGMSIVNGAQTTGSIASVDDISENLRVGIRFVKASRDDLIENVVRYNNSQNKITAADFRSNDPIQQRLRQEFEKVPDADYEGGRRGGASDIIRRSKYTLPSYTVGQALAAFHGDPVTAYDKKSELWTNEKNYRNIFTERTNARHIVLCYSLLEAINKQRLDLIQKHKKNPEKITDIQLKNLDFLSRKGSNYLLVYVISQCLETILLEKIANKFDLHFKENISPEKASSNWKPIISIILSLSNQLENAFSKNRISNETVMSSVPNFVGVVASIASLQEETFAEFRKLVEEKA